MTLSAHSNPWDLDNLTYEDARELKLQLERFMDSPMWGFLTDFINTRIEMRSKELFSMCPESVEQMVRFARLKGGLEELGNLPVMIEQIYSDVDTYVAKVQKNEVDATRVAEDGEV